MQRNGRTFSIPPLTCFSLHRRSLQWTAKHAAHTWTGPSFFKWVLICCRIPGPFSLLRLYLDLLLNKFFCCAAAPLCLQTAGRIETLTSSSRWALLSRPEHYMRKFFLSFVGDGLWSKFSLFIFELRSCNDNVLLLTWKECILRFFITVSNVLCFRYSSIPDKKFVFIVMC